MQYNFNQNSTNDYIQKVRKQKSMRSKKKTKVRDKNKQMHLFRMGQKYITIENKYKNVPV